MKKLAIIGVILIVVLGIFVSANMIFVDEDDNVYNIHESNIPLEKGWNLVSFGNEIKPDSEIQEQDIKAVFYYDIITRKYIEYYPDNSEFEALTSEDTCGDKICSPEERESYSSWCSRDCKTELNDNIVSNLNVLKQETFILKKDEKRTMTFDKYFDLEIYWNEESLSGSCAERGYANVDCVVLHNDVIEKGLDNDREFINSPDDGNPYNDRFGKVWVLSSYTDKESAIYAKVDYTSNDNEYAITIYEINDYKLRDDYEDPIPSIQARIINQPAWVYSKKSGELRTKYDIAIKTEKNRLSFGWNLIKITPEFAEILLKKDYGSCDITKAYFWDIAHQKWMEFPYSNPTQFTWDGDSIIGYGLVVKVSDSCYMGAPIGTGGGGPPALP